MSDNPSRYAPFIDVAESRVLPYPNFDPDAVAIQSSIPEIQANRQTQEVAAFEVEQESPIHHNPTLTKSEKWSLVLVFFLYFIGAIPIGFYGASLPVLLAEKGADYKHLGLLLMCRLLVSFKPLFAPFLDTVRTFSPLMINRLKKYIKSMGRRRTYILPIQYIVTKLLVGLLLIVQSLFIEEQIENREIGFLSIAAILFTLLICLQEIAAAGWTVSLFRREFASYSSTSAHMGSYIGTVISHHIFILITSAKFSNQYFSSLVSQGPLLTPSYFFLGFGVFTLILTIIIHLFKDEGNSEHISVHPGKVFSMIKGFYTNSNLRVICIFLLIWKIGFSPIESVWVYRMIHKGYPKESLTLMHIGAIPLRVLTNYLVGIVCKRNKEMILLIVGFVLHFLENVMGFFIIYNFKAKVNMNATTWYLIICQVIATFQNSLITISLGAFFNRIAEKKIGGTYISTLHAILHFGRHLSDSAFLFLNSLIHFTFMACFGWVYAIVLMAFMGKKLLRLETLEAKE